MGARIIGDFPTGPLSDLYQDRYSSAPSLQYPLDLGNTEQPHYILFNVNVPEKSSYVKNGSFAVTEQSITSQADINRAGTDQLGSSTDPLSGLGSALVGGLAVGAVGAVGGAVKYAGGALSAGKPVTTAGLVGSALPGILTGGLTTALLSQLDVTRKTRRTEQEIKLYVPNNIMQQLTPSFTELSMTDALGMAGFAGQAASAVGASLSDIPGDLKDAILGAGRSTSLEESGPTGATAAEGFGLALQKSGAFGSGIERVALNNYGYAKNPQVEVLFDTVALREFQFDFKFTPKNAKEAQTVLDIIKTFRFHAAPELVPGSGRYFIPPSEFDISFMYRDNLNSKLFKISTCVCTGVDVNYVTAGQFATYYDGTPIEIEMVLKFKEVEIMHKDLITQGY